MIRVFQRHCNFSTNSEHKPRPEWFDREKIFESLINTLDNRVEYIAFHDCGNGDIKDHFLNNKNINKISKHGGNDAQSFLNLLNYVNEQDYEDDDIIYFLEGADYYTLYDHPDKYYLQMYENLQSKIIATPSVHWRTTPSTTNTYACKFKTLKQHFPIHVQYCDLVEKWTKDHDKFTHLWNEGSNLVSCIPGYSTHVEGNMLSPIIKWTI